MLFSFEVRGTVFHCLDKKHTETEKCEKETSFALFFKRKIGRFALQAEQNTISCEKRIVKPYFNGKFNKIKQIFSCYVSCETY